MSPPLISTECDPIHYATTFGTVVTTTTTSTTTTTTHRETLDREREEGERVSWSGENFWNIKLF
jgi:hypothetical protein